MFISEVKKILGSKTSMASVMATVAIIFSTIDGFNIDEQSKQKFKSSVVEVKEEIERTISDNLENEQIVEEAIPEVDEFHYVRDQIMEHEGFSNSAYLDSQNIPTIGVGVNLTNPHNQELISQLDINNKGVGVVTVDDLIKDSRSNNKIYNLSDEQVELLFNKSLELAESDARQFLPNLENYPDEVRKVLVDMSFNLGLSKLLEFKKMRKALINQDYQEATKQMINSDWYHQVGDRSKNLVDLLTGI